MNENNRAEWEPLEFTPEMTELITKPWLCLSCHLQEAHDTTTARLITDNGYRCSRCGIITNYNAMPKEPTDA